MQEYGKILYTEMRVRRILLLVVVIFCLFLAGCKKDNQNDSSGAFDRKLLLENMADNIIIPHWEVMQTKTDLMVTTLFDLTSNPSQASLSAAQNSWVAAYLQWQHCNAFNYGPAEKSILGMVNENLGTWPVNTAVVESRIQAGDYKFNDFRRDSRGFLTLEYLLYADGALDSLTSSINTSNRKEYLTRVAGDIKSWIDDINTGWKDYRDAFVNNTDKSAGSPTSNLYNEFVKSFESVKNFKVGLPAGKRAGQVQTEPQLAEAYYSGLSVLFMKENFKAAENIWRGVGTDGTNRTGFDDYLDKVTGGIELKNATVQQLTAVNMQFQSFNNTEKFSELVKNDLTKVNLLHTELQKMTRYFKSDLSSLLGIAITFSSSDGD